MTDRLPLTPRRRLHRAIVDGDADEVERHLAEGLDGFTADFYQTPLEVAVSEGQCNGRRRVTRVLLDAGIDPRETYDSILPLATRTGDIELVELLLMAGAEDTPSESGDHALEIATAAGNGPMVDLLLEASDSPPVDTALWSAAEMGHEDIFSKLEALVEDSEELDKARQRLRRAVRVAEAMDQQTDARGIHDAIQAGNVADLQRRLAQGGSADALVLGEFRQPLSALSHAAAEGDLRLVGILLGAGASVDGSADAEGRFEARTPLVTAIRDGALQIARRLIADGADVGIASNSGAEGEVTPLLELLIRGIGGPDLVDPRAVLALVNDLVQAGVDLEAADHQGQTAVFWAAKRPAPKVLKTLLGLGARAGPIDHDGHNPASHVLLRSQITDDPKQRAELRGVLELLGGQPTHRHEILLMAAAFMGDEKRCRRYLSQGADPDHQLEGWSATDYARAGRHLELVDFLASIQQTQRRR